MTPGGETKLGSTFGAAGSASGSYSQFDAASFVVGASVASGSTASVYLNEMNNIERKAKWNVSFSYGRALQHSCLRAWGGSDIDAGQKALIARAQANSEAAKGQYVTGSQPSSDEKLFVAGYTY